MSCAAKEAVWRRHTWKSCYDRDKVELMAKFSREIWGLREKDVICCIYYGMAEMRRVIGGGDENVVYTGLLDLACV